MEELPNGKYKFFERYKDPYTEKLKKVSVTMEKKNSPSKKSSCDFTSGKDKTKVRRKTTFCF